MNDLSVRRPQLVFAESDGRSPMLRARSCICGYVICPPHTFGCERCGEPTSTTEVKIEPCGVLTAVTTVFAHPKLQTPYGVGRVTLDAGPVVDVRLEGESQLAIGSRVRGQLMASTDASGVRALDLHFVREGQGE